MRRLVLRMRRWLARRIAPRRTIDDDLEAMGWALRAYEVALTVAPPYVVPMPIEHQRAAERAVEDLLSGLSDADVREVAASLALLARWPFLGAPTLRDVEGLRMHLSLMEE